tara:strand:+ start:362 stop:565 length:204 start_codon:yes stop_codon:yes gene_type:complete
MNVLEKLKILSKRIEEVHKNYEDLIESDLANRKKIKNLENNINNLKVGIKESAQELEEFMKDLNANS